MSSAEPIGRYGFVETEWGVFSSAKKHLPVGKLPANLLEELLAKYSGISDPRVIIGPRVGEDAAVLDVGGKNTYLVVKTDPITFASERIGWYAVNINANDVATLGAVPRWFLATVFLPEGRASEEMARTIFADMSRAAKDLGVALCGGHTEITAGLERPVVVGQMLGEVEKDRLVRKTSIRPGDNIILTKGIAIEGTAILARERERDLAGRYGGEFVKRAQGFLYEPGISVVREASIAAGTGKVHAMHDLTEGGLSTGIVEIAGIVGLGATVNKSSVYCYAETEAVCSFYGLDPMGVISSGALLIAVAPDDTGCVLDALRQGGVRAEVIGSLTERGKGFKMVENGEVKKFPTFEVDEIARLFESEGEESNPLPR